MSKTYPAMPTAKTCVVCGTTLGKKQKLFCSLKCRGAFASKKKNVPCSCGCGTIIKLPPSRVRKRNFVNNRHKGKWMSQTKAFARDMSGKKNPNFKTGEWVKTDSFGNFDRNLSRKVARIHNRERLGTDQCYPDLGDDELLYDTTKMRKHSPLTPTEKIRIKKKSKTCPIDGKVFEVAPSEFNRRTTCSRRCAGKLRNLKRKRDAKGRYI